jgi:hypothetical protein
MADDSAQNLKLGHFGDGKLKRNHFPWTKLTGYNGSQPILRDFKAATVNAEISFLPQDLDDQRQFRTVAGVTSCRGLVHAFDFLQFAFLLPGIAPGDGPKEDTTIVTKTCRLGKGWKRKSKVRRARSFVTPTPRSARPDKRERYTLQERTRSSTG